MPPPREISTNFWRKKESETRASVPNILPSALEEEENDEEITNEEGTLKEGQKREEKMMMVATSQFGTRR
jgi:hypothetical protein